MKYNESLVSQVREGKLAVHNINCTKGELQNLIAYIFPKSLKTSCHYKYYYKSAERQPWYPNNNTTLPYKSVKEFLEEFVLPEKWFVERNEDNHIILNSWLNKHPLRNSGSYTYNSGFIYSEPINKYGHNLASTDGYTLLSHDVFTEITFDQFCKYVLKKENNMKEKEIIGYKLIKPEYYKVAQEIGGFFWNNDKTIRIKITPNGIEKLRKSGVLDLWFEPVYEPEKPIEVIVDMGSFQLKVTKEGIFHNAEDITSYVVDINMFWKNVMREGNMKFGKNYDCLIPSNNIIIEKSGCEKNQTTLTKWINVYNELLKLKN